ncbi:hypothetical protein DFH08DRAFT_957504 [Mycena albidolilacea]|uniref:Uncharacterized protein n=1 Tax=Mycena albidolilacea TaxID=1033008 RepID=A0AAD7A814_9AGAR|nr:hypothetical protein DFH08DRAFT_957504 [Mycena albidolilacea]
MTSEVVENLAYLSKYLDQSRARVSELEKELTNVRRESTNPSTTNQILQLEADKAKLQYELEGLQDELKDARQKHKDECLLGEALQAKCTELAGMAAKALRERLEGEEALEEMRKKANETQGVQGTYAELQAATDGLVAASTERYALLKTKYKQIKEDKTSLRGSLAEQDAQINCLKEKVSQIKAEYEAAIPGMVTAGTISGLIFSYITQYCSPL